MVLVQVTAGAGTQEPADTGRPLETPRHQDGRAKLSAPVVEGQPGRGTAAPVLTTAEAGTHEQPGMLLPLEMFAALNCLSMPSR